MCRYTETEEGEWDSFAARRIKGYKIFSVRGTDDRKNPVIIRFKVPESVMDLPFEEMGWRDMDVLVYSEDEDTGDLSLIDQGIAKELLEGY